MLTAPPTPLAPMEPFNPTSAPALEEVVEDDPVFRAALIVRSRPASRLTSLSATTRPPSIMISRPAST